MQSPLPESYAASSTGTWAFIHSLGSIWSIAIPAAIFNSRFNELLPKIEDDAAHTVLANGQAYAHASSALVSQFTGDVRDQVIQVYALSLRRTWQVSVMFAGISFLVVLLEKEITMRTELVTEFGIKERISKETPAP